MTPRLISALLYLSIDFSRYILESVTFSPAKKTLSVFPIHPLYDIQDIVPGMPPHVDSCLKLTAKNNIDAEWTSNARLTIESRWMTSLGITPKTDNCSSC